MDDIEDIIPIEKVEKQKVKRRYQKHEKENKTYDPESLASKMTEKGLIPGSIKVCVKTFGCSHNMSDSEYMMGILVNEGFQIVDDVLECDIIIINSCTVKGSS